MAVVTTNLGTITAYGDAVAAGYTGTKAQWQALMANYATVGQQAAQDAQTASQAAQTATTKAGEASQSATAAAASAASITTPDATLTQAGVAADAKATGDEISDLKEELTYVKINNLGYAESLYKNGYSASFTGQTNFASAPFILQEYDYNFYGKVITAIKLKIANAGKITIGYIRKASSFSGAFDSSLCTVLREITVSQTGEQTIHFGTPIAIPSGCSLFFGASGDTAKWYYGTNLSLDSSFYYISNGNYSHSAASLGIDFYITDSADVSTLENYIDNAKPAIAVVNSQYNNASVNFYNGYNGNNATSSRSDRAPFFIVKENAFDVWVTSIELKIATVGTLTIGTIKREKIIAGSLFDSDDLTVQKVLTINEKGHITIHFDNAILVRANEYLSLGSATDTAAFLYGTNGTDKGFVYINAEGKYSTPTSDSIGITVLGAKNTQDQAVSVYSGKSLSILGNSISTFDGYIPEGNLTYYPTGTVLAVTDTWWKKLIDALGMTLNVNNSWSGSRVTTTNGSDSAGCGNRCEALGTNPDVIIVWMGINDFNNEVEIGTYDGKTALPNTTTTFREAYAIMLNKILTAYPTAEVWVCTLIQCERNGDSGFPEINGNGVALADFNKAIIELADAFGVKVLDHNKCGLTYQNMPTYNPDNLHPNKYGHSLIANNDIKQMDNAVRTRY